MASYSIYSRPRKKNKPIFYVQFKKPDGAYTTAKSTGQTTRRAAVEWVENYLEKHGKPLPGRDVTFAAYAENFFDWNGAWATNKRVQGERLSISYAKGRADMLVKHVLPALGAEKLQSLDKIKIRNFRNELWSRGYSGSHINKALGIIRAVLTAAEDEGYIAAVPKIERAAERPKPKGILSIDEVRELFAVEWVSDAAHCHPSKPRDMGRTANMLAAMTGLRLGELQALQIQDLRLDSMPPYIIVRRSWDRKASILNETTKTGRERNVILPRTITDELRDLILENPFPGGDSFLFYSSMKSKPAEKTIFIKSLFEALRKIGINTAERKARNITFHSWRHWFNSLLLNARVPVHKVQAMTGHVTDQMTQRYYHAGLEDFSEVADVQESIFIPAESDKTIM